MRFKKGMTIYICFKDGKAYHIGTATVEETIQEYTTKGRAKKPKYRLSLKDFMLGSKSATTIGEEFMDGYSESAVEAVCFALSRFFENLDNPSAEERLLRSIFGEASCKPKILAENISEVIKELISIEKALSVAYGIDADNAQRTHEKNIEGGVE